MQPSEEQERPVFLEKDKKFVIKWKLVKFLALFLYVELNYVELNYVELNYVELNFAGKIVALRSTRFQKIVC